MSTTEPNGLVNSEPNITDLEPDSADDANSTVPPVNGCHSQKLVFLPALNIDETNSIPRFSALSSVSLSSPDHGPSPTTDRSTSSKVSPLPKLPPSQPASETWRDWSFHTYKVARQLVTERLGRGERTVDAALETQIGELREVQTKYANLLNLARALTSNFYHSMTTQRKLSDSFSELALLNGELCEAFTRNADTQKVLVRNGDNLLRALNTFTATLNTLCSKTFTDTLATVKLYEAARIEFDAHRLDLETLVKGSRDAATSNKMSEAETRLQVFKEKYERLRADVDIKIRFLDENRVKVMRKQLLLFHNAVSSYFSGDQLGLEETLKQFNICTSIPNS